MKRKTLVVPRKALIKRRVELRTKRNELKAALSQVIHIGPANRMIINRISRELVDNRLELRKLDDLIRRYPPPQSEEDEEEVATAAA